MIATGCELEPIRYILHHEDPEIIFVYVDPSDERIEQAYKGLMSAVKIPEVLKAE